MALNARGIVPPAPMPHAKGFVPLPMAFPTTRILPEHCMVSHLIACADGTYDVVDTHILFETGQAQKVSCDRPTLQSLMYDRKEARNDEQQI